MDNIIEVDELTLSAILEIYRADLEWEKASNDIDDHAINVTVAADKIAALETHLHEVKTKRMIASDAALAQSMADEQSIDDRVIDEIRRQEEQAENDRRYARQLAGLGDAGQPQFAATYQGPAAGADAQEHRAVSPVPTDMLSKGPPVLGTVNVAAVTESLRDCVSCLDKKSLFDIVRLTCGCGYCRDCIQDYIRSAIKPDGLFPPICCNNHIDVKNVSAFLPKDLTTSFEEKTKEFNTTDRTYCSNLNCGSFIDVNSKIEELAHCLACSTDTCTKCKKAPHAGHCPEDKDLQAVLATARQNKWRHCSKCNHLVSLTTGCNHMTCRCGNNFCYECGGPWKKCACPTATERRVMGLMN